MATNSVSLDLCSRLPANNSSKRPVIPRGVGGAYGAPMISLSTKKIKGLHENDFIMASKIDRLLDRPDGFLDHKQ